jgi:hypothetical protein
VYEGKGRYERDVIAVVVVVVSSFCSTVLERRQGPWTCLVPILWRVIGPTVGRYVLRDWA